MKIRKVICLICALSMALCMLGGCGTDSGKDEDNKVVMTVGEYEIRNDELMLYCILELLNGTMTYEDVQKDEAKYKQQVIDSIVETKMVNDAAKESGLEFTKDDENTRDSLIKNFTSYVTIDVRNKYGISDELIDSVFQDTSVMNKLENDTRNELGKKLTEENKEKYKDYNFQRIYYITFPKVKADDEGSPLVDDNGNYVPLDEKELSDMKTKAESAVKEINSGADVKEVAKKYGVDTYSEEKSSYVGAYADDMNEIMDSLTAGKCTDVYEAATSYYAIAVLTDHDEELLESFAYEAASADVDAELAKKEEEWIGTCDEKGGIVQKDDTWDNFSLLDMATYLNDQGLMK